jgi:hypothetical protein
LFLALFRSAAPPLRARRRSLTSLSRGMHLGSANAGTSSRSHIVPHRTRDEAHKREQGTRGSSPIGEDFFGSGDRRFAHRSTHARCAWNGALQRMEAA